MEDEAVYPYLLIACHTDPLYQVLLIAKCAQCGHEPAVSIISLSNVVCGGAFYEELWIFEDVLWYFWSAMIASSACMVTYLYSLD